VLAHAVAAPVLERLQGDPEAAALLGGSHDCVYLSLPRFVVAVTGPGVPLMPNGVAVTEPLGSAALRSTDVVEAGCGRLRFGGRTVTWDAASALAWDSRPVPRAVSAADVAVLGAALLKGFGVAPTLHADLLARAFRSAGFPLARGLSGRLAIERLLASLLHRDPDLAGRAAVHLAGHGSGLTPEGDDLLSACAAAVALLGPYVSFGPAQRGAWLTAVRDAAGTRATGALPRTLLELACEGHIAQPLHGLVSEAPLGPGWPAALARLRQVGSETGLVYGLGFGAAALLLARTLENPDGRGEVTKEMTRC
jgi:hypothetical protein